MNIKQRLPNQSDRPETATNSTSEIAALFFMLSVNFSREIRIPVGRITLILRLSIKHDDVTDLTAFWPCSSVTSRSRKRDFSHANKLVMGSVQIAPPPSSVASTGNVEGGRDTFSNGTKIVRRKSTKSLIIAYGKCIMF